MYFLIKTTTAQDGNSPKYDLVSEIIMHSLNADDCNAKMQEIANRALIDKTVEFIDGMEPSDLEGEYDVSCSRELEIQGVGNGEWYNDLYTITEYEMEFKKPTTYPEYILKILRQYDGLENDDTSKDNEFSHYTPREVVDICLQWEGISGYTNWLLCLIKDAYGIEL